MTTPPIARPWWHLPLAIGIVGAALPVVGFISGGLVGSRFPYPSGPVTIGVIFVVGCLLVFLSAAMFAESGPPISRGLAALRHLIVGAGVLAPVAVVLALRLSSKTCTVMNPLWLPWDPHVHSTVQVASIAIIAIAAVGIIVGYAIPSLRRMSNTLLIYGAISTVGVMVLLFAAYYGDPGPNCVPY
jgi:hypothetical protein